ncbi:class I SAM-dependent methyltransferase [Limnospira fusiformis KN01]|uniref:class I SAM-dependent methyltransferase n=1 Tax=Limnospira TaxID=2596745 RepID=UPI001658856E|nr:MULTISPECIES: class I SAM-dependent methyltransferase [Limnospira]MDT9198040.1 class I SAM-dependent methyltransferase [Limnospira sp. PMC 1042.18]ULB45187.1 class I SAM-dependent methyltransferase [Limnospira fusiformis KN01]
MKNHKQEWEKSYVNRDNFVFYPHEEVIRFVSKYIRKRIGLMDFQDIDFASPPPKILDVGCGIGRHVIYCEEMGLDAYGIDLSEEAVRSGRAWLSSRGIQNPEQKIFQGDIRSIPFPDRFFNYALSHGVLDSLHFELAKASVSELHRTLVTGALFYCDLISGDDSSHSREYCGENVVINSHEHGTVQSYFNFTKIQDLFNGLFNIQEAFLMRRENIISGTYYSRYHLILSKKTN